MKKPELLKLRSLVDREIEKRSREDLKSAKAAVAAVAKKHGLSVSELISDAPKPSKTKKSAAKSKKPKPAVKYRDPENPELVWSGMGRRPVWLAEKLSSGKPLEDYRV